MNFARLNHVLVPQSAKARQAWLHSRKWRWLGASFRLYLALTPFGRALLLFGLFAGAMGLNVTDTGCYVVWSMATGLLVVSIAARRWYRLDGLSVRAVVPRRVKVGMPLQFKIEVSNARSRYHAIRVQSPFLPWDGKYVEVEEHIQTIAPQSVKELYVSARFVARGQHSLMPFVATRTVAGGIAAGPGIQSNIAEFIVVPNYPKIVHMDLPIAPKCQPQGVPFASKMGEASELAGVRPYVPGDRVRDLHAGTWAKTGIPHVKQFQQEYFSRVGVVLDVNIANVKEREFESAISLTAGVLSYLAQKDALVDVLCVGNQFHDLTIGRSLGFFEQGLDLLATVEPSDPFDASLIERRLHRFMPSLSSLIVICLKDNEPVTRICSWSEQVGVPCRCFHVVASRTSSIVGRIHPVLSSTIQSDEDVIL